MAITAVNGVAVTEDSSIMGISGLASIFGQTLAAGGGGSFPDLSGYGTLTQVLVGDDAPSGSIATWPYNGTGSDATQATSGARPTRVDSDIGGRHSVSFGGDDWLQHGDATAGTVFLVFQHATGTQDYAHLIGEAASFPFHGDAGTDMFYAAPNPTWFQSGDVYADGALTTWAALQKSTSFRVITCKALGGTATLNRIATTNGAESSTPTRVWNGKIACLVYFSNSLNDTNRHAVEDAIGAYYGITITH